MSDVPVREVKGGKVYGITAETLTAEEKKADAPKKRTKKSATTEK